MAFSIPNEYGYCLIATGVSWFMNWFLSIQVMQARKTYDVQYPALYAESSHEHHREFNSVQRAHQNTLEAWAPVSVLCLADGLVYPRLSSAFYGVWVLGRVIYGVGYAWTGPKGRTVGAILSHVGDFPLVVMAFVSGGMMLTGSLK